MRDVGIGVEGLAELRRALRRVGDKVATRELGQAGKTAAGIVAERARSKVPVQTGRARDSVRAVVAQGGGAIKGGRASVPYYAWLDFGGRVGRNRSVERPFIRRGRYIYPALDERMDDVIDTYEKLVAAVFRDAGLT